MVGLRGSHRPKSPRRPGAPPAMMSSLSASLWAIPALAASHWRAPSAGGTLNRIRRQRDRRVGRRPPSAFEIRKITPRSGGFLDNLEHRVGPKAVEIVGGVDDRHPEWRRRPESWRRTRAAPSPPPPGSPARAAIFGVSLEDDEVGMGSRRDLPADRVTRARSQRPRSLSGDAPISAARPGKRTSPCPRLGAGEQPSVMQPPSVDGPWNAPSTRSPPR